jgi:DNA-binding NtrC family response regulator
MIEAHTTHEISLLSPYSMAFCCTLQVLVLDNENGPAHLLIDTISRLFQAKISVTLASNTMDALHALDCGEYDLVAVGAGSNQHEHLTLIPYIRAHYPCYPVVVISKEANRDYTDYGVCEALTLPNRASELKSVLQHLAQHYLNLAA